jgi:hypothetical protein
MESGSGTNDSTATENTPLSAQQFRNEMQLLIQKIQDEAKQLTRETTNVEREPLSKTDKFFSSGKFFILLGLIFLGLGYLSLERGVHTSFSFVLIVLGIATLLFGTGTQGIGRLESNAATAKYNVAIAGGAGVLAIAIGWGMTALGPQIQQTFGLQTRYVEAEIQPNPDSNSSFSKYWAQFEIDGEPIPSVRRGELFVAYIPYRETQKESVKHVRYKLLPVDNQNLDPNLKPVVADIFDVPLRDINPNNSGSDFPIYDKIPPIDMRSAPAVQAVLLAGGSRSLPAAPGAVQPNPAPPAALEGQ